MAKFEFSAFTRTIYNFTVEADDYETALEHARTYLGLQTKTYIKKIDLQIIEEFSEIDEVEEVFLDFGDGESKDITKDMNAAFREFKGWP